MFYIILIIVLVLLGIGMIVNPKSAPFVVFALIAGLLGIFFPPAEIGAVIMLIIAFLRLFV